MQNLLTCSELPQNNAYTTEPIALIIRPRQIVRSICQGTKPVDSACNPINKQMQGQTTICREQTIQTYNVSLWHHNWTCCLSSHIMSHDQANLSWSWVIWRASIGDSSRSYWLHWPCLFHQVTMCTHSGAAGIAKQGLCLT